MKKKLISLFLSCFLILVPCCLKAGQKISNAGLNPTIDSLQTFLKKSKEDTTKVNTLNTLCRQFTNVGNYEDALRYAEQAQGLARKLNYQKGLASSYNNTGIIYWFLENFEKTLYNYREGLKIRMEIGDKKGISGSYNNIGSVYEKQGNYEKALENHLNSLKISEEIGYKQGISTSHNNIGSIYFYQGNLEKALSNYLKSLEIMEEIGDKRGIAVSCNNIGSIYLSQGNYSKALENQLRSIKFKEEIGDKPGIASSYNNVGNIFEKQGNYEKALDNYLKGLKIHEEIGFKHGVATSFGNIGGIYMKQGKFAESNNYINQSLILFKELGYREGIKEVYAALSELSEKIGDFKQAYNYHKLFTDIKDTLLNEQSNKQIAEMNTKYDSEKKDKELIKKDAEINKQVAETEKQNLQRNAFIIGFFLVLVLAFFIFRSYRQKQNSNKSLEEKNILIEKQKQIVEEKNLKITDSINYARRIQQAILPSQDLIKTILPESFIFFKPKSIVSGDFYWMHAIDDHNVLVAAVDCTGHGVPGALMSMMGYNLLEQVVKEHLIYEPAMILNELSKLVVESLKQTNDFGSSKESMDIALCKINYENYELEYAGAHNSLYLIRNGKLSETKADNRSIGFSLENTLPFSNHKIQLEKADCLYVFSDGYADQFGGANNEKFYYQPFREMLTAVSESPMDKQQEQIDRVMIEWKGDQEQIDDMLVIGVKI